jgi:hypothetical protein
MSSLIDLLTGQLGADSVKQISQQISSDEGTTSKALSEALPLLLGALAYNTTRKDGAEALSSALDKDHDGSVLNDLSGFLSNAQAGPGDGILRHVLGSKRSTMEAALGKTAGLNAGQAGQILAMAAPLLMGALGQAKRQNNLNAQGLASLLQGERKQSESRSPGAMGLLGNILDTDADGDVDASDIARKGAGILGKLFGRR